MKKFFALFLVLLFIFSLAACTVNVNDSGEKKDDKTEDVSESKSGKKDKDAKDTGKTSETKVESKTDTDDSSESAAGEGDKAEPSEGEQAPQNEPEPIPAEPVSRVIVSMENPSSQYYADDGTLLFVFSCQSPHVFVDGRSEASDAINAVLEQCTKDFTETEDEGDGYATGEEGMFEAAEEFYKEAGEYFYTNFALERRIYIPRIDESVLSLLYNDYYYIGGAHGGTVNSTLSFDVDTGELLTLDSVFSGDYMDFFRQRVIDICESEYSEAVYPSYEDYIDDFLQDGCWHFDENGIVFIADEYVIAPYASGPLDFPISYAELADYIDEKYVPVRGDVSERAEEPLLGETGDREVTDYIVVGEGGEVFSFLPQGRVTNISLNSTTWYEYDDSIHVINDTTLWACSSMDETQALMIENMFPDVVPNIGITCTLADGSEFSRLLYQSGEDGSILFSEYR